MLAIIALRVYSTLRNWPRIHCRRKCDGRRHSLIRDKVNASTSDLALGTVSSLVASQVFTDWFQQPAAGSRFVIAALDEDLKGRLGAQQKAVMLSDETLTKQRKHHPELILAEYQLLPKMINTGMVIKEPDQRLVFFESKSTGKLYMAVIKTTGHL